MTVALVRISLHSGPASDGPETVMLEWKALLSLLLVRQFSKGCLLLPPSTNPYNDSQRQRNFVG